MIGDRIVAGMARIEPVAAWEANGDDVRVSVIVRAARLRAYVDSTDRDTVHQGAFRKR